MKSFPSIEHACFRLLVCTTNSFFCSLSGALAVQYIEECTRSIFCHARSCSSTNFLQPTWFSSRCKESVTENFISFLSSMRVYVRKIFWKGYWFLIYSRNIIGSLWKSEVILAEFSIFWHAVEKVVALIFTHNQAELCQNSGGKSSLLKVFGFCVEIKGSVMH